MARFEGYMVPNYTDAGCPMSWTPFLVTSDLPLWWRQPK